MRVEHKGERRPSALPDFDDCLSVDRPRLRRMARDLARELSPAPGRRAAAGARRSPDAALLPVLEAIYEDTDRYWREYSLCEDLVDLESQFQLWRFRHMRTVMRIIGFKRGTGGSSGVGFLKQALELTFFPELFEVRTMIGPSGGYA